MKKRIAFISDHASPLAMLGGADSGGQNVYVDKITKELALLGYEIDIYTRWENEQMPQIVNVHNRVRVIHIKAGSISPIPKEKLLSHMNEFSENVLTFIRDEQITYHLVHANFFLSGMVAIQLKKELGVPFVITFHALGKVRRIHQKEADAFPDERFIIEEQIIKEADHIIAECPQDREDLIYYYHTHQDKLSIIPCGFDPHEFYPIDKRLARMTLGLPQDGKIILQLGRMVKRKGIDTVIKAIAILKKTYHEPLHLIIVGGESDDPDPLLTPEIGRLQIIAKEYGVSELVTFIGRRGRELLKYFYNAADIFISTPWYEPFGITPLESMACGTPVIGSEVGGIKFTVLHGKTGFLIPPKDEQTLSSRMHELLTNEKLSHMFEENAIARVNSFFTWQTVAQSLASLYGKILYAQSSYEQYYQRDDSIIQHNFESLISVLHKSSNKLRIPLMDAARVISQTLAEGNKVLLCGNGGSATDAQHFAAELIGHFQLEKRPALPLISLTTDTAVLTAVSNDFSYEELFSRQIEALGKPDDVLIGISTSGNSKNMLEALKIARAKNMICIGLLGKDGGKMLDLCDISLVVPSTNVQIIQEIHTHLVHTLCELIEKQLFINTSEDISWQPLFGMKQGKVQRSSHNPIKEE